MSGDDDDFSLDDILSATAVKDAAEAVNEAVERANARAERARELDSPPPPETDEDGVERQRKRYAADPRDNIMGLKVGDAIVFSDSGEELDGRWIVAKVEGSVDEPASRALVASRDGKTGPFARIPEDVLREELGLGRLKLG